MRTSLRHRAAGAGAVALLLGAIAPARADSTALWTIVHTQCVPHFAKTGSPDPCTLLAPRYAILKDRVGIAQFLLIPTSPINGIEHPALLDPNAPNYWEAAWKARRFLAPRLHAVPPRDAIGLAVNSAVARTQNQLHIHIDCVRQDVIDALRDDQSEIGAAWSTHSLPPARRAYLVRRLEQNGLGHVDPFKLVADQSADVRGNMALQTIAVIGASFTDGKSGFYLLSRRADITSADPAAAEELLDHDCRAVAHSP